MTSYVPVTIPSIRRITEAQKAEVLRRIKLEQFGNQIARAVGISACSVRSIAKANGLTLTRLSRQERGRRYVAAIKQTATVAAPIAEACEWRAKAWASRRFAGDGYAR